MEKNEFQSIPVECGLKPNPFDGVFHDSDELKTNLDLQCRDAGIRFTCI